MSTKKKVIPVEDIRKKSLYLLASSFDEFPDYSLGDILYSLLQPKAKESGQNVSFLRKIDDEEYNDMVDMMVFRERMEDADVVVEEIIDSKEKRRKKK